MSASMVRCESSLTGSTHASKEPSSWPKSTPLSPATVKGFCGSAWARRTGPAVSKGIVGIELKLGDWPKKALVAVKKKAVPTVRRLIVTEPLYVFQSNQSTSWQRGPHEKHHNPLPRLRTFPQPRLKCRPTTSEILWK